MKEAQIKSRSTILLMLLSAAIILNGCATQTTIRHTSNATGNVGRLEKRPDFTAAVKASPEWCRDALHTVDDLESQNQELRAGK